MSNVMRVSRGRASSDPSCDSVQGYLAHKKTPTRLGPPQEPRHGPTVGSYAVAVSYERGTPVQTILPALHARGAPRKREIGGLLPNNQHQRRTCYALCHMLYPVSAAHTSIFRMDSNSTPYKLLEKRNTLSSFLMNIRGVSSMSM